MTEEMSKAKARCLAVSKYGCQCMLEEDHAGDHDPKCGWGNHRFPVDPKVEDSLLEKGEPLSETEKERSEFASSSRYLQWSEQKLREIAKAEEDAGFIGCGDTPYNRAVHAIVQAKEAAPEAAGPIKEIHDPETGTTRYIPMRSRKAVCKNCANPLTLTRGEWLHIGKNGYLHWNCEDDSGHVADPDEPSKPSPATEGASSSIICTLRDGIILCPHGRVAFYGCTDCGPDVPCRPILATQGGFEGWFESEGGKAADDLYATTEIGDVRDFSRIVWNAARAR